MTERVCPECESRGVVEICPRCGTRTLMSDPSDASLDPLLGKVFDGRYRIEMLLGRGGMGAVYKAVQIAMNKVVAVKVVRPELGTNLEAARRFHREAKAASTLSHPHTIRVFDFGQAQDRELYMVMEFLAGQSLGALIRSERRLPYPRAVRIAAQIASSLTEAHGHGLVHRDLKPDNVILLDLEGDPDFVKVLDFGIAKFLTGSTGDASLTRTGAVIGTPAYMAPEQTTAAQHVTTAVDVYALGILMYQMVTGRVPYQGDTPVHVLMAHVNQPVPEVPAEVALPDELRELLRRMLSKSPADRPSIKDVVGILEDLRMRDVALAYMAKSGASPAKASSVRESIELIIPRRSHARTLGVALAVTAAVVLLAGVTYRVAGSSLPVPALEEPAQVVAKLPEPAPAAASKPAEPDLAAVEDVKPEEAAPRVADVPATPPKVVVRFQSVPPGAAVFEGDASLGQAPFDREFEAGGEPRSFAFRLAGYDDALVTADVGTGTPVIGVLEKPAVRVDPPREEKPKAAPKKAKPKPKADYVDY